MSQWRLPSLQVDFIVNQWIGHDGYELAGFSHRTLDDLFIRYCSLTHEHLGVSRAPGFSERDRITMALENANAQELTCLIESILAMLPRESAEWRTATREAQIRGWLSRIPHRATVDQPFWPEAPSEAVAPDLQSAPEGFLPSQVRESLQDQQRRGIEGWFASPTESVSGLTPGSEPNFPSDPFASHEGTHERRDFFISHASEDKDFARSLIRAVQALGASVWFDERELMVGDSLSESIARGLRNSWFGVVILSQSFFAKRWPRHELKGLIAREMRGDGSVLPIWHWVTEDEIREFDPALADKIALDSRTMTVDQIAESLYRRLRRSKHQP